MPRAKEIYGGEEPTSQSGKLYILDGRVFFVDLHFEIHRKSMDLELHKV